MNQNTEYEKFTQEIYQELNTAKGITINVEHNKRIAGKSGQKHQIDVYWEYKINGVKHIVIVECKNYNSEISVGKIRDFYGLLCDLPNVSGIMVTKVGYQKGAKKYADYYSINLKELRTPNEEECTVGEIEINLGITHTTRLFSLDNVWAKEHNINWTSHRSYMCSFSQRGNEWGEDYLPLETIGDKIFDEEGKVITTFNKLEDERPQKAEYIYNFDNAYVNTRYLGQVKIRAIKYTTGEESKTKTISIDARNIVKAILKDALNGDIIFFFGSNAKE